MKKNSVDVKVLMLRLKKETLVRLTVDGASNPPVGGRKEPTETLIGCL
jgi:hypothetical protein